MARKVSICIDGVPFRTIIDLQKQGYFQEFKAPNRVISAYPSLTRPNHSVFHNYKKPKCYESIGFQKRKNLPYYIIIDKDFRKKKTFESLYTTVGKTRDKIRAFTKSYFSPNHKKLFKKLEAQLERYILGNYSNNIWVITYDQITHRYGTERTKRELKSLSKLFSRIIHEHPELEISLWSDHGAINCTHFIDLKRKFKDYGFSVHNRLWKEKSVILSAPGITNFIPLFHTPSYSKEIHAILDKIDEISFFVYHEKEDIIIRKNKLTARITKRENKFKYEVLTGDPLNYSEIINNLEKDQNGFISNDLLFINTTNHKYPDALHRIYNAFRIVENPGDVLIDLEEGFFFGKKIFRKGGKGTHGSLSNNCSECFYMDLNQERDTSKVLRIEEVSEHFNV
ncbi:hypothetical protein J4468_00765 [Candidatus Woesearchaeota archaeon]|nr:hypothetical protein [Candidatus Woesearchaeota archaeon]